MTLIKKEFKFNFKNLFIWIIVITLFNMLYAGLTDFMIKELEFFVKFLERMPKQFLSAFNMDVQILSKPEGLIGSEGMTFMFIFFGLYASMLSSKIFAGEFDNKTIEYLLIKPYSRSKIYINKIFVIFIDIVLLALVFYGSIVMFFLMYVDQDYSNLVLFGFFLYLLTTEIFFASISVLISLFFQKRKLTNSITLGLLFFMYFGVTVTEGVKNTEFLRRISVFYYMPIRDIVLNQKIYYFNIFMIIILSLLIVSIARKIFEKKDIII
ncbi:hypothetical protein XO12_08250 [Marinitoga sp. 1154]|uniref:ABC transporter permease subunit n=1 Tax=Marinitoga sp. 1154 TaxID=1643335 RepID=UPI0015868B36|nr:ABC transporter permease subunit [Marinitoga sp. 1154]NUV00080.1 hypothetical protein [Marinitoga sp. 1154]